MRRRVVAGNWKMNMLHDEAVSFLTCLEEKLARAANSPCDVLIASPFPHVQALSVLAQQAIIGAQNCHQEEKGAYTGEVSAPMLRSVGADFVILGHSERREYFQEDEALLAQKVQIALRHELNVIFCVGEKREEREQNKTLEIVEKQLQGSLSNIPESQSSRLMIAYEPVWAIGTGLSATSSQAQEVHASIRGILSSFWGQKVADTIPILYGGSCKPDNAKELFSQKDIDGGLIGGASLKVDDFLSLIHSF